MSIKIYNGYKMKQMTLSQLQDFCMRVREKVQKKSEEEVYRLYASKAANLFDGITFGYPIPEEAKDSDIVLSWLFWDFAGKVRKSEESHLRDPYFDFTFKFCIYPMRGKILATIYGEKKSYTEIFESFEEVEEYFYFNNTDRPEEISSREWRRRARDWDKAFCGYRDIPSMSGFTVDCVNKYTLPFVSKESISNLLKYFPSLDKRIDNVATDLLQKKFFSNHEKKDDKYSLFRILKEYYAWEKTDIGTKRKKNLINLLDKKIIKDINEDKFLMEIGDIKENYRCGIFNKFWKENKESVK